MEKEGLNDVIRFLDFLFPEVSYNTESERLFIGEMELVNNVFVLLAILIEH